MNIISYMKLLIFISNFNKDYYYKAISLINPLEYTIDVILNDITEKYITFLPKYNIIKKYNIEEYDFIICDKTIINAKCKIIVPLNNEIDLFKLLPDFNYTCLSDDDCYGFFNEKYIFNYETNKIYIVHNYHKLYKTNYKSNEIYYINNEFQKRFEYVNEFKELENTFDIEYVENSNLLFNFYDNEFYLKNVNEYEKININILNYLTNCVNKIQIQKINYKITNLIKIELHFTILILSYNNEKYVRKNIHSAMNQRYSNFRIIFRDCDSSDNTFNIANEYNIDLIKNTKRKYQTENFLIGTKMAKPNSIIVSLDGDDFFENEYVLRDLNLIYLSTNCNMTYGSFTEFPRRDMNWHYKKMKYNNFNDIKLNMNRFSHLRTWKKELLLSIDEEELKYNNEFPKMAGDISIMLPMFKNSINNITFIKKIVYVYNTMNKNSDCFTNVALQIQTSKYFYEKN